MKQFYIIFLLSSLFACSTPAPPPTSDPAADKKAIWDAVLSYAELMRANKYEDALRTMFPKEYTVVNAKGYHTTYADTVVKQSLQYINAYNVRYEEFEPQPDPVIEISEDGKMAYAIAQIKMGIVSTDAQGNEQREERLPTFFSVLKKVNGKWEIAVSSQHR